MRRIFGVGVDICVTKRPFEVYSRQGVKFLQKALNPVEIETFQSLHDLKKPQWLASRFAFSSS